MVAISQLRETIYQQLDNKSSCKNLNEGNDDS